MHLPLFVPLALGGPGGLPPLQEAPPGVEARLEALVEAAVGADLPGLAVVVDVGGEALYSGGAGHAFSGHRVAVDAETRLPVPALVEQLVAIALLERVEAGALGLDDPLGAHLAAFAEGPTITLRQVLSHTSGLARLADLRLEPAAPAELSRALADAPLAGEPGDCFAFTAADIALAGLLLRELSGEDLTDLLADEILEPLDLDDTSACGPERDEPRSTCHEIAGRRAEDRSAAALLGLGCLCSTAADLARLQRALVEGDVPSQSTWQRMRTPVALTSGHATGYGCGAGTTELAGTEGSVFGGAGLGASFHVVHYPALDLTIALLGASEDGELDVLERRLARTVLELPEPEPTDLPLPASERARYAGTYQLGCIQIDVAERGGRLVYGSEEHDALALRYQGGHAFLAVDDPDVRLEFELDGDDLAQAVVVDDHGARLRAIRLR